MMGARLDPNQLLTLHVLLEEGHVTRAAARLGIGQSSMSHRLASLRDALGDPLFFREGSRLVPSPRAQAMAEPLANAFAALEQATAPPARFDPSTARSRVHLWMPDLMAPALPHLLTSLREEAPGLDLVVAPLPAQLSDALRDGELGLALAPTVFVRGDVVAKPLGELRFAVLGRREHPALRRPLRVESWLAHPHVVVSVGNGAPNPIEDTLRGRRLERRVGLIVPTFLSALFAVRESDLLLNAPVPLVVEAQRALGLRHREPPIELPRVRFSLSWHPRAQREPAHVWVRARLFEAARRLFASPRAP